MFRLAAGATLALLAPAAAQRPAWTFADALASVTDLDALWQPPRAGEHCVQFSSYDRRSDAGPGDADAWFANGDRGQFLREVERDGRTEYVLVDADGPGQVVRIWSANPSGRLLFFVDREPEPRWVVDFADLCAGRIDGLAEPWCGMRARGGNCHLPIPFARHLEVRSDAHDFYYQVNVRRLPDGVDVRSFEPGWLVSERAALDAAGAALAAVAVRPDGLTRAAGVAQWRADTGGDADGRLWWRTVRGSGVLRELRVRVADPTAADDHARAALLRTLVLRVTCDGERTVDVPLPDFFASAPAFRPWAGLALGVLPDGTGTCRFPMPFAEELTIEVLADARLARGVLVTAELGWAPGPVPADALRFHASWHLDKDRRTRPFGDHLVLAASGPGRYVGTSLSVRNPTKAWWGEGDEKVTVDDESFPSTFGTGTEDYFGYAWCCPERFVHPLHAQPSADGPANFGYSSNVRLCIADAIPFHESLRFDLEVWHWQDVVVDYATVAYWYGARGATSGLPALPPVADRIPVVMEPPVRFVAEGVLEGEALEVVERTGGSTQVQDLSGFSGTRWSRDAHLWWIDGAPGDRLVLALPVAHAGRYRVQAALTTARDYGIVRIAVNGTPLGDAIDLYTREVRSTGLVELGVAELAAGTARLELELIGHNEKAEPRHMVGLDYVKLVPVE